ncbi:MAG: sulfatase [Phycisphaeraceae bacterium]|nr:sulfatase [Phycisphaeraceae bacterium]
MLKYRDRFLFFVCFAVLLPAVAAPRNVVLIVADDQSQTLGCYGDPVARTPNLDALAADGTLFRNAFATTASCSASRSVILSGLHNHANGQYGHVHHFHKFQSYDNVVSLPRYLSVAGYRTARFGKYHVAPEQVYQFDEALRGNPRNLDHVTKACKPFLEQADDRPFFLYFCTHDPHRGNGFAKELPEAPDRFGNPSPGKHHVGVEEVVYDSKDVPVPGFLPDSPAARAELAQYYQSQARVDQSVGRLFAMLKEAGHWDDTLILYLADHGMAFPGAKTTVYDGGLRTPLIVRNPYNDQRGLESDAMISWVDLTPTVLDFAGVLSDDGKVEQGLLQKVKPVRLNKQRNDELKPGVMHGRSFLETLTQEKTTGWDQISASHTFHEIQMYYPMRVVQERRYKLIWNIAHQQPYPFASDLWESKTWQTQLAKGYDAPYGQKTVGEYVHRPAFELYDLQQDPYEGDNLADDPAYAEVLETMKKKLKDMQERTNDPWIMKWRYE